MKNVSTKDTNFHKKTNDTKKSIGNEDVPSAVKNEE
jgi:hypothetical protein